MHYSVKTSENITFLYELSGLASRIIALLVDTTVIIILTISLYRIFYFIKWISSDIANAFFIIVFFLLNTCYFIFFEWLMKGQSIGKKIMKLRVISEKGLRPSIFQLIIRNLFRIMDQLPFGYLTAGVSYLLSNNSQRLGDMIAGTIVIKEPRKQLNIRAFREWESYNTLSQDKIYRNKILRRISIEEKELLIDLLLRADSLSPHMRLQIFSEFADYFQKKIGLERPEFLSPEKFIKNITYILIGKPI
ncbi:MAG: RDD family protein [Candidatus Aureabacteria bacterium]|nr:RDD family protein [Candidatus Auribacterota bacterium]